MNYYRPNRACHCARCTTRGLQGPAVLVTVGVLFLIQNMSNYSFGQTWPVLLLVIGAVQVIRYIVPDEGHVNPGYYPPYTGQYPPPPPPYGQPQYQPPAQPYYGGAASVAPAPAPPPAPGPAAEPFGESPRSIDGNNDEEAHNG